MSKGAEDTVLVGACPHHGLIQVILEAIGGVEDLQSLSPSEYSPGISIPELMIRAILSSFFRVLGILFRLRPESCLSIDPADP